MSSNKGHTPAPAPPVEAPAHLSLEERMDQQETALLRMQEQLTMQLNGVANQLYLIKQLRNPAPDTPPDAQEAPQQPPEPPNTI